VLVSDGFLAETELEVGETTLLYINRQYVNVELVGSFAYFPTWEPGGSEEFIVANLDTMQDLAARVPVLSTGAYPTEAWLGTTVGVNLNPEELLLSTSPFGPEVTTEANLREIAGSDPLVAASWEGILFLSFASVLLLTALGFVVYSFLTAQARSLEFAILRTMGFSTRQIFGLVSFEQVFVIVAGAVVGTFLGMPLSGLMIDFMGVNERGEEVIPPIVTQVSWSTVLTVYSLLAVVFVATIVALAILYSRLSVHRALRMGEL
jgi:predicted lysophospholipase L1 biosynthesis ABC-type transport system permease subunit